MHIDHARAQRLLAAVVLAAALGAIACDGEQAATPTGPATLARVGGGTGGTGGTAGCRAAPYRQFDFWLGSWDVYAPGGAQIGTNVVVSDLDGCAVEENWTGANGNRGRSLNAYDATTGRWSQMWVADGGGYGAFLLLEGGLDGDAMVMTGTRIFADFGGFRLEDTYRWTPFTADSVQQYATVTPPIFPPFDGRYVRRERVAPAPEAPNPTCAMGAEFRRFDFLLGEWTVRGGGGASGDGAARSRVRTDLNGCLVEERITGADGRESLAFAAWSPIDHHWHRTSVDDRGTRLVLSGDPAGDGMVLTGRRIRAGGDTADVRMTWAPGDGGVALRIESSTDGGATWRVDDTTQFSAGDGSGSRSRSTRWRRRPSRSRRAAARWPNRSV